MTTPADAPRCAECRHPLSDPVSIQRGHGPRCWEATRPARLQATTERVLTYWLDALPTLDLATAEWLGDCLDVIAHVREAECDVAVWFHTGAIAAEGGWGWEWKTRGKLPGTAPTYDIVTQEPMSNRMGGTPARRDRYRATLVRRGR